MSVSVSPENEGLLNLQRLVDNLRDSQEGTSIPIVLVSGFSGWGEALFGTFNYWGGFEDLPTALSKAGYTVIVVRIGPLSSDWERACEVYAQLSNGQFDHPDDDPTFIDIDYGYMSTVHQFVESPKTKRAVMYRETPVVWKWGLSHPANFIAHSQGGNTIRMLIELMGGNHPQLHPSYFVSQNRQTWIKSLVTLGTPHKGTTVTDVVQGLLPPNSNELILQFITSASFKQPRFYDLHLDHWGFAREGKETFLDMKARIEPKVNRWWNGDPSNNVVPPNGFYDNSIQGVQSLNAFAPRPSAHVFYFTMSFDATTSFPSQSLTKEDLATFPSSLASSRVTKPIFDIIAFAAPSLITVGSKLPGVPSLVELAKWAVGVANRHLRSLGYFDRIPTPGPRIPRSDMLPILLVTALGMGGFEGSTPPGISTEDYQMNDGIVNTRSMKGPNDKYVSDSIASLNQQLAAGGGKEIYWHLGINKTMDHADEIGVFTVGRTYMEVELMYKLFAQLLSTLS